MFLSPNSILDMVQPLSTIEVFPEDRLTPDQLVEKWTVGLCRALQENYDKNRVSNSRASRYEFRMEVGRKYYKIKDHPTHGGVHAFVDKKTGEVYKPASWRGPAKGVRYDLRVIEDRQRCYDNAEYTGGYLYLR